MVPVSEILSCDGVVAQQIRRDHQEVLEVQGAIVPSSLGESVGRTTCESDDHRIPMGPPPFDNAGGIALDRSERVEVLLKGLRRRLTRPRIGPSLLDQLGRKASHLGEGVEKRLGQAPIPGSPQVGPLSDFRREIVPARSRLLVGHEVQSPVEEGLELETDPDDRFVIRRGRFLGDEVDVRVLDHPVEDTLQLPRLDPQCRQLSQIGVSVGGQLLQELDPERLLHAEGLRFQDLPKPRIQARLEGTFAEELRTECVDGPQEGLVDLGHRFGHAGPSRVFRSHVQQGAFQGHLKPLPQLGGRLSSKRDGGKMADLAGARAHQGDHTLDHGGRLAGPGPRLDEEVLLETLDDPEAGHFIGQSGEVVRLATAHGTTSPKTGRSSSQFRASLRAASSGASPTCSRLHPAGALSTSHAPTSTPHTSW